MFSIEKIDTPMYNTSGGDTVPRRIEYIITEEYNGKKVKHWLRGEAKISVRLMNSLKTVEDGITLNGEHIRTIDPIKTGDILALNIPDRFGEIEPIEMELDIVYEDEDFIVINKPAGIAMHPTHNHQGDTLANALTFHLQKNNKPTVFRAVGRLDKGTSGIVICALNPYSAARIPAEVEKEYYAVVGGKTEESGSINAPIYRPDPMKTIRCVDEKGDFALTHYKKISGNEKYSFVKVKIETGRTHQIRVHFSHLGMPLVGDSLYGEDEFEIGHQLLHCRRVELTHPVTKRKMIFKAKMPREMNAFIIENIGGEFENLNSVE